MISQKEKDLLNQLEEIEIKYKDASSKVNEFKRKLVNAETDLLNTIITKDKLKEELRIVRNEAVDNSLSQRDLDIIRFKEVLPEILKKDKFLKLKD